VSRAPRSAPPPPRAALRSARPASPPRLLIPALTLLLCVLAAPACRIGYLAHLGAGQLHTLLDRRPLDDATLARLSEPERQAVAELRAALEFGASLGLARTTSYRHLIERGPDGAVQVVVAAPADRLEAVTWWFPITGRISYRGFFDLPRARDFAAGLAKRGYDVNVRPALLYSTLGVFDDPIPREMLGWERADRIGTVLHELVHETVFVSGDPDYNEGLASFIERGATLEFLAGDPDAVAQARRDFEDEDRFAALLARLEAELTAAYATVEGAEAARRVRAPIFARYQHEEYAALAWNTQRYAGFRDAELSNAWLVARQTYLGDLPCFAAELDALGGDLRAFIRAHREHPGHRAAGCVAAS
jgi:predicted aminopeptidase